MVPMVALPMVALARALTCWRDHQGLLDGPTLRTPPDRAELRRFFSFGAFIFVLLSKQLVYNQGVLLAAVLGTASGAAHQCLYSLFRLCCTIGDVTGATAQAFLPQYYLTDQDGKVVGFDAGAARGTIKRIVAMTGLVALTNTAIAFAVPLLMPGLFTTDFEVMRLMRHAAPWAAAGLLMHPSVVGMEGCLLATKDIRWLVSNYVLTGGLSVLATQLLLKLTPLRRVLDLNAIWIYLATYQGVRFLTFQWRLLLSSSGILRRSLRAQPAAKKATGKDA
jgi:Na+-driven multidrug efflux pump